MTNFEQLKQRFDNDDMFDAILGFPNQIESSLKKIKNWSPKHNYSQIKNILITGMGGSAIGGDFVATLSDKFCQIPIIVNRSYEIPNWVNEDTLVISSSYSGNTEETLTALDLVCGKNAHIIAVTTGGKLLEIAEKNNFDIVNVTPGLQPRAALGLSMALNLLLLEKIGLVSDNVMTQFFENSLDKLKSVSNQYSTFSNDNPAIQFAELIHDKFPIIYAGEGWQANCALRMRGQLAENAKILGSNLNFPEQNHNEIEGWTCNKDIIKNTIICWILDKDDHIQVQKRMKITKELLSEYPSNQIELKTEGNSEIERALCLIHLIDWISYYSALLNKVDPTPVERITELKNKLK